MLKKTITYTNFDGKEVTEDLYFNLTKTEIMEMELGTKDGMVEKLQAIINAKDNFAIYNLVKDFVLKSYGEKSEDGKRFMKVSPFGAPLSVEFSQSAAFDALFSDFFNDDNEILDFIKGVMPGNLDISEEDIKEFQETGQIPERLQNKQEQQN